LQIIGKFFGRAEYAQAYPVVTVIFQNLDRGFRLAVVFEYFPAVFSRFHKRHVGADGVLGTLRSSPGSTEKEQQNRWRNTHSSPAIHYDPSP
jgi:hypothetical protein